MPVVEAMAIGFDILYRHAVGRLGDQLGQIMNIPGVDVEYSH